MEWRAVVALCLPGLASAASLYASCSIRSYPGTTNEVVGQIRVVEDEARLSLFGVVAGLEVSAIGGWHVHTGFTCDDAASVGDHYYTGPTDPWTATSWSSDATGAATLEHSTTEFSLFDDNPVAGRAIVVHASDGSRVGCGLIEPTSGIFAEFSPYPGATDARRVSGLAVVTDLSDGIHFAGVITGLEANVTGGLHVHEGYTCRDAAGVGGLYVGDLSKLSWIHGYASDHRGVAVVDFSVDDMTLFYGSYPVAYRPFVVHLEDSTEIGCGLLGGDAREAAARLEPDGGQVEGLLQLKDDGASLAVTGIVTGLPASSVTRWSVSTGYACGGNATEGEATTSALLQADEAGVARVDYALNETLVGDVAGLALIVRSDDAGSLGCGLIQPTSGVFAQLSRYPGYAGRFEADGWLLLAEKDDGVQISGVLAGLEPDVSAGVRVHDGYSCETSIGVGGDFSDALAEPRSPWVSTAYQTNEFGIATVDVLSASAFTLFHGSFPVAYHAVVVDLSNGTSVGCGLAGSTQTSAARIETYEGYRGNRTIHGLLQVENDGATVTITGLVAGLQPSKSGDWHVSSAFACDSGDKLRLESHFVQGFEDDPWSTTTWEADEAGNVIIDFTVDWSGATDDRSIEGRAVIFYGESERILGCGLISPTSGSFLAMASYPGVKNDVVGSLLLTEVTTGIYLEGVVAGLETDVTGGLHVHKGFTCEEGVGVGGHYYEGLPSNPWAAATYTSDEKGSAPISITMANFSLSRERPVQYRSTIVHKREGGRSGCAIQGPLAVSEAVFTSSYTPTRVPTPMPTPLPTPLPLQDKPNNKAKNGPFSDDGSSSNRYSPAEQAIISVIIIVGLILCVILCWKVRKIIVNRREKVPPPALDGHVVDGNAETSTEECPMVDETKGEDVAALRRSIKATAETKEGDEADIEMLTLEIEDIPLT
mmetsp:Transcript_18239/g.57351  ORF Transcript_18239/g.57351 Transcript_18239/m.57351 type:complete len:935 (-) Transcript_18239:294-3098(-)